MVKPAERELQTHSKSPNHPRETNPILTGVLFDIYLFISHPSDLLQLSKKSSPEERWSSPSRCRASSAAHPAPAWTSWCWSEAACNWLLWSTSCSPMTLTSLWHSAAETGASTKIPQQSCEIV